MNPTFWTPETRRLILCVLDTLIGLSMFSCWITVKLEWTCSGLRHKRSIIQLAATGDLAYTKKEGSISNHTDKKNSRQYLSSRGINNTLHICQKKKIPTHTDQRLAGIAHRPNWHRSVQLQETAAFLVFPPPPLPCPVFPSVHATNIRSKPKIESTESIKSPEAPSSRAPWPVMLYKVYTR